MAFLNNILTIIPTPSGMWQSIIIGFDNFLGSYVLAILLLTLIIRLILVPLDTANKYLMKKQQKTMLKMQPELENIERYKANPEVYNQKRAAIQKKYSSSMMGGCIVMLIFMIIQPIIFLTLWSGLSSMSTYKSLIAYENVKSDYANVLAIGDLVEDEELTTDDLNKIESIEIVEDGEKKSLVIHMTGGQVSNLIYQTFTNEEIVTLLNKYVIFTENVDDETGKIISTDPPTSYNENLLNNANKVAISSYKENTTSFLWIKNIWKADTPFTTSIISYSEISNNIKTYYVYDNDAGLEGEELENAKQEYLTLQAEYEKQIYDAFMTPVAEVETGVNGYFILAILAIILSFLSMFISTHANKGGQKQNNNKVMLIILPLIMGFFALMYTSIFALYIIFGQIIVLGLLPLQNLIIKKIDKHIEQKEKKKSEVIVDYRRK